MVRKKRRREPRDWVAWRRLRRHVSGPHAHASRGHATPPMVLAIAGVGVYLILFYATRLPSLEREPGAVFRRFELLWLFFLPEELLNGWFGKPAEFAIVDRLPVLAIAGVILACAFGLGRLLLVACRAERALTRLERFVFSTAVGLNLLSTYVLAVGLAHLADNRLVMAVPGVLALAGVGWLTWRRKTASSAETSLGAGLASLGAGLPSLGEGLPSLGAGLPTPPPSLGEGLPTPPGPAARSGDRPQREDWGPAARSGDRPQRDGDRPQRDGDRPQREAWLGPHWLWLAAPFALAILLGGMMPPVEFDVREYHLQVPKEFFQQGYVGFLPHNVYGNMPMGTEMLSLLAMAIAGDWWLGALAGKTVIAAFAPLTALGLLAAGRRLFSPAAGVVAAIVYLSIPWIAQVSSLGLVEGALACYLLLALYAVLLSSPSGSVRRPATARGTALGAGLPTPPKPAGSSGIAPRRNGIAPLLLLGGYLAGGAVATKYPAVLFVLAPLAAWIVFDRGSREKDGGKRFLTPFLPLGVFLLAAALGCGLWFAKSWTLTGNPTYPLLYGVFGSQTKTWTPEKDRQWNAVHRPKDFSARALARDTMRVGLKSEWLSPLVMPLAALAFLVRRRRRLAVAFLAYFVWVIATWWLLTHRIDRFWIPVLPLVALLAGAGACWNRDRIWRRALIGLLAFGAVSNFLVVSYVAGGDTRYFVSLRRLRHDPARLDPWHAYFNTHARGGRVLMVGEAQVFDLEVPILYSTCFDDSPFERLVKGRAVEEVRAGFAREGISHVYVHWGEIHRYRSSGNYGFTDFVEPAVFARLVRQRVLEPLPEIKGHPGRGYRVVTGER